MDTSDSKQNEVEHSLRDHFLVAMPSLVDSYFSQTLTYICDHNANGAMGIVINQEMDIKIPDVLTQLGIEHSFLKDYAPILAGGPVNEQQGLILHRNEGQEWESSLPVTDSVSITASKDIVSAIAENRAPSGAQLVLGYAGWSPGQLEEEITRNSWLTVPADEAILFDTPVEKRWSAVAKQIGIDLNLISSTAGHA